MDMIEEHLQQSSQALGLAARTPDFMDAIRAPTQACVKCPRDGGKLLIAGNGGSAGDARHIAGEFQSRLNFDRSPLAAIALTTDASVLAAIGNDYGYEHVFERQARGLARPSTSTPMIQEIYMVAAHALCGAVEQALFGGAAR